jgi:diphosphomevalonate decarboxylase
MMSGRPSALYMEADTIRLIHALRAFRESSGVAVYFTLDAGPNLHVLCEGRDAHRVEAWLRKVAPVAELLHNRPGSGTLLSDAHLI